VAGNHTITLGAFVSPLSVGTHTVSIHGVFSGAFVQQAYAPFGFTSFEFHDTYTVTVTPH
jgi:hypothetical protein